MDLTWKDARTASHERSIWLDLTEDDFRQHLVILQRKVGPMPIDPQVFSLNDWNSNSPYINSTYTLPLNVEQRLADDFAFLAAVEEGGQSVAAVCIEEHFQSSGMTLRFAAMDISRNEAVGTGLRAICEILSATSADEGSLSEHANSLFEHIIRLHRRRLLARLRSSKWEKPEYLSKSHKKPLWRDFENLAHRAEHAYTRKEKMARRLVEGRLEELATVYENFEACEDELASLMHLVDASFAVSSTEEVKDFAQRLQHNTKHTHQVASAIKSLRQIQKIGSYRRICISLIATAKQFPVLFQHVMLEYLDPYQGVPTTIGYHEWATTCHVHAEVQLAVHYDLNEDCRPRCIGTSKWLCYLCYHFIDEHGLFFPSKTHGRIFDQWTAPDLIEFGGALVTKYRRILKEIDNVVLRQCEQEPQVRRLQRMTSCDFWDFGQS